MRVFKTGATRDSDEGKLDYEGFFAPMVLRRYAEYMHKHRKQADGKLRDSDNWQKGIPALQYRKSLIRHTMDLWFMARYIRKADLEDLLCAVIFNAMGWLFEILKRKGR